MRTASGHDLKSDTPLIDRRVIWLTYILDQPPDLHLEQGRETRLTSPLHSIRLRITVGNCRPDCDVLRIEEQRASRGYLTKALCYRWAAGGERKPIAQGSAEGLETDHGYSA